MTGEALSARAASQSYVERPPVPALRELVSSVWVQHVARDAPPYTQRHLPNGAVELACRVGARPRVIGPLVEPLTEVLSPGTTVVGMRFVPGAFSAVAGQPVSELTGRVLDVELLWGRSAAVLGEAISAAPSPAHAAAALERDLRARVRAGPTPDALVSEAVRALMPWRPGDIASLAESLYISETQLRRRCRTAVGLAPKALHRMLRFQGFLALVQQAISLGRAPTDDALVVNALRAGYADQSHLTRECVRLTGVTPRVFLTETHRACACGHDHSATFTPVLRGETLHRGRATGVDGTGADEFLRRPRSELS